MRVPSADIYVAEVRNRNMRGKKERKKDNGKRWEERKRQKPYWPVIHLMTARQARQGNRGYDLPLLYVYRDSSCHTPHCSHPQFSSQPSNPSIEPSWHRTCPALQGQQSVHALRLHSLAARGGDGSHDDDDPGWCP